MKLDKELTKKIISEVIDLGYFDVGTYERIYPDIPDRSTKGTFCIVSNVYESYITFDIVAQENKMELTQDRLLFFESFKELKDLELHLMKLLSKFKDLEDLNNHLFLKFRFTRKNDVLLSVYNLLKDVFVDGTSFEDFHGSIF